MNNRHRRVAKLKAQEEKRLKAKATYELVNRIFDGLAKGITALCDAIVDVVDSIYRGIDEALHK